MRTEVPGPEARRLLGQLTGSQDTLTIEHPVDLEKSIGNYLADCDGNFYLDTVQNISSRALGYNQPEILELAQSKEMAHLMCNRTALGLYPPTQWIDLVQRAFMDVAPPGLDNVQAAMCGSCAVEGAFKFAFMARAAARRGGFDVLPTAEELCSAIENQ